MGRFRFGPLGRLMVVDSPRDGFAAPVDTIGALHESLNATRTKDVFGYKSTYKIPLEGLDPRALSWFEMAYRGALGNPLYFLDEQRVNWLSPAVSSALSAWAETDPFVHLNGVHTVVANTFPLLPDAEDGGALLTPGPTSALSWTNTATGNIIRCGPMIPVTPGEDMSYSVYVLSTTGGTPTLEFTPFDSAGVALGQLPGASDTQVTAGSPPRYWIPYIANPGVAAVQPCIRHAVPQTSVLTGFQLEKSLTPTPWVLGQQPARVLVDDLPLDRRFIGNYMNAVITLLEV